MQTTCWRKFSSRRNSVSIGNTRVIPSGRKMAIASCMFILLLIVPYLFVLVDFTTQLFQQRMIERINQTFRSRLPQDVAERRGGIPINHLWIVDWKDVVLAATRRLFCP